jgi:hypothetical protein
MGRRGELTDSARAANYRATILVAALLRWLIG